MRAAKCFQERINKGAAARQVSSYLESWLPMFGAAAAPQQMRWQRMSRKPGRSKYWMPQLFRSSWIGVGLRIKLNAFVPLQHAVA